LVQEIPIEAEEANQPLRLLERLDQLRQGNAVEAPIPRTMALLSVLRGRRSTHVFHGQGRDIKGKALG
jgi:hypothetical protein